jgi:hypothetical protein
MPSACCERRRNARRCEGRSRGSSGKCYPERSSYECVEGLIHASKASLMRKQEDRPAAAKLFLQRLSRQSARVAYHARCTSRRRSQPWRRFLAFLEARGNDRPPLFRSSRALAPSEFSSSLSLALSLSRQRRTATKSILGVNASIVQKTIAWIVATIGTLLSLTLRA